MNEEQIKLAEGLIGFHKQNGGVCDWEEVENMDGFTPADWSDRKKHEQLTLVRNLLDEMGLITLTHDRSYRSTLTRRGFDFISFEDEKKKETEANKIEQLSLEKLNLEIKELRNKFFDYEKTKSRIVRNEWIQWLTILLSAIAIVISLLAKKSG